MRTLFLAAILAILAGCATGTHIITGNQRSPIPIEQVKLYQTPPAKYEVIGIVNATEPGRHQAAMDGVTAELKRQAAKIGANGVILSVVAQSGGEGFAAAGSNGAIFAGGIQPRFQLSGQAIYVPPN
jgi:hypothetical protein